MAADHSNNEPFEDFVLAFLHYVMEQNEPFATLLDCDLVVEAWASS